MQKMSKYGEVTFLAKVVRAQRTLQKLSERGEISKTEVSEHGFHCPRKRRSSERGEITVLADNAVLQKGCNQRVALHVTDETSPA